MLPFMKPKTVAGLIISKRKPDAKIEEQGMEDGSGNEALDSCAADLISAIHSKDIQAASAALRAAFEIFDSEPHVEGPHTNEEEV